MPPHTDRLIIRIVRWALALAVSAFALFEAWLALPALLPALGPFLVLFYPALAAAFLGGGRRIRFAPVFVLAGLATLPAPGGLVLGLAAALAGGGAGVAAGTRRGVAAYAATAVALVVAQLFAPALHWPVDPGTLVTPFWLLLLHVIIQGFALALDMGLTAPRAGEPAAPREPTWRTLAVELCCVPLAWVLVVLMTWNAWLSALGYSLLVLAGLLALLRLDRAQRESRRQAEELASRLGELNTIHAIGREILSTMDPAHAFATLERECRKIFDFERFTIVVLDHERSHRGRVFERRQGQPAETFERRFERGLVAWVVEEKRPRRIDDLPSDPDRRRLDDELLDPAARALIALPLIVQERVIGVLTIQSATPAAYDEHQLSVLTTIGQQAAVAIDNARHFRRATVDSLTGFYHRDHFFQRLDAEYQRSRRYGGRFAMLMVDLDGFKSINDEHGHLAGDTYLSEISRTVRAQLRAADLACRYGGDEFCLLLPETDIEGARVIAERIRDAVGRRIIGFEGLALRTTVSIGVAAFPQHDEGDVRSLIARADEALYRAKKAGRDCVVPFAA